MRQKEMTEEEMKEFRILYQRLFPGVSKTGGCDVTPEVLKDLGYARYKKLAPKFYIDACRMRRERGLKV
jgi:hypothetical protein